MALTTKEVAWTQLGAAFDNVSSPEKVDWGKWRDILNMQFDRGQVSLRGGWRPWGHWTTSSNADLHDQLLDFAWGYDAPLGGGDEGVVAWPDPTCGAAWPATAVQEPVTSLHDHVSSDGLRLLMAGTQSRIYEQMSDGRWRLLASHRGGSMVDAGVRWRFASLGGLVFATNNVDEPQYYLVGSQPSGCAAQAFHPIPDLRKIGVVRAGTVVTYRGTVFMGDVTMDGVRVSHRMVWSNANAGLEWARSSESTAGLQDFSPGECILGHAELGDSLYTFTTQAIWRTLGTSSGFVHQRVFAAKDGAGCIAFPHSLAPFSGSVYYLGTEGRVYSYTGYAAAPVEQGWVNLCTNELRQIGPDQCRLVSAVFRDDLREYLISYAVPSSSSPNRSLALDIDGRSASHVDAGFWALASVVVKQSETLAEWMVRECICSAMQIADAYEAAKTEPLTLTDPVPPCTAPANEPLYTYKVRFEESEYGGFQMEEFAEPPYVLSPGVMCQRVDFLEPCAACPDRVRIVASSAADWALKHVDPAYYRRTNWTGAGYGHVSYTARLRSGAMIFEKSEARKRMESVALGFDPVVEGSPWEVGLKVGQSDFSADPLVDGCPIRWFQLSKKPVQCPKESDASGFARWRFMVEGRHLYLDLVFSPKDSTTAGTFHLSSFTAAAMKSPDPIR